MFERDWQLSYWHAARGTHSVAMDAVRCAVVCVYGERHIVMVEYKGGSAVRNPTHIVNQGWYRLLNNQRISRIGSLDGCIWSFHGSFSERGWLQCASIDMDHCNRCVLVGRVVWDQPAFDVIRDHTSQSFRISCFVQSEITDKYWWSNGYIFSTEFWWIDVQFQSVRSICELYNDWYKVLSWSTVNYQV